jgi:hypothetical protein
MFSAGTRTILRFGRHHTSEAGRESARTCRARAFSESRAPKNILRVDPSTGYSPIIHSFSTALTSPGAHTTLETFMHSRTLTAAIVAAVLAMPIRAAGAPAAGAATLLRVFLTDGTSLISYGEPARVGDRIIFSMPTATQPDPPLHLVNLPADRVDWDRTNRYAATARATHYVQTQAEDDYAALSNDVASTLNEIAHTPDPATRLAIVERARQTLAEWPQSHYNYREGEVRQMLGLLDEAIADLRAARGANRFELTLSAFASPPTIAEPLLPPPANPKEAIEQVLAAARVVDTPAERTSLLTTVVSAIDREKTALPAAWATATRAEVVAAVAAEVRVDRSYQLLTARMMTTADRRARQADVRGLERLLLSVYRRDSALGAKRPDAVNALVGAVEAKLDAARQLRLARDRWAMRAPALRTYRVSMSQPMALLAEMKPSLQNIKSLSGSTPAALAALQRRVARVVKAASTIVPPEEVAAAHALLVSAAHLAGNAAQIRREAVLAGDMARAWDASSAAAGALMLGAKARADILAQIRLPQLR